MNSDRQSRLPDYVGKKIVEALRQDKEEAQILEDTTNTFVPNFSQQNDNEVAFDNKSEFQTASFSRQNDSMESKIEISDLELPDNVMMLVKLIDHCSLLKTNLIMV